MFCKPSILLALLTAFFLIAARSAPAEEFSHQSTADMEWFREARFGMFIHWGLYSQAAGEWKNQTVSGGAEWIQKYLNIPTSEYAQLTKTWNPTRYDPREWVRQMKAAGIRYICITSKHHDGFCLWPTRLNTNWNISATPGGKDLLQPLAEACHEAGIRFCLYHSVLDWHHPDWPARPTFNDTATGRPDKTRYKQDYLYPQLRELFTNYGPISMVWLDGTWDSVWTSADGEELEKSIRSLQPDVVINNRSGYKPPQPDFDFEIENPYGYIFSGDYISPEGEVPPTGLPGIEWETCQTMQLPNNWGYNRTVGFRPYRDLLQQLIDVASKGGNLLLNVGPHADGSLLPQASDCLAKFAVWMAHNSESIHGTNASPFRALPFSGRCTHRPGRLYLHIFDWPTDRKVTIPMRNRITRAYLLADEAETPLPCQETHHGISVTLPDQPIDPVVSVVAVDVDDATGIEACGPLQNLAANKPVTVSSIWPGRPELSKEHLTDGDPASMWATAEAARQGWVEVDLEQVRTVSAARLNDDPYNRIQQFSLEAWVDNAWKTVATGGQIDRNQLIFFPPVESQRFRLTIHDATDTPTLADFQLLAHPEDD